jgi:hypothetical protein
MYTYEHTTWLYKYTDTNVIHIDVFTLIRAHKYIHVRTDSFGYSRTYLSAYTYVRSYIQMSARIHKYICTCTHVYIHTYIYTHTHLHTFAVPVHIIPSRLHALSANFRHDHTTRACPCDHGQIVQGRVFFLGVCPPHKHVSSGTFCVQKPAQGLASRRSFIDSHNFEIKFSGKNGRIVACFSPGFLIGLRTLLRNVCVSLDVQKA